jgi:type I restriction enzyme S subunit
VSVAAYESYRDSGVNWLGAIPEHWRSVPFWSLFRRNKRTGYPEAELLSVYRDYGVIRKSDRDDNHNNASEDLGTYQLVEPGDLAVNKMKAWQGSLGVSPYRGIVSPAYFVYNSKHNEDPLYLHYLLRSAPLSAAFMAISKGIRINQWDVDPDQLRQLPIALPPLSEQSNIAAFLDRETAKIDALVEAQRRLIELLREKRQAVISHAVTKGLDPTAPMKDSGVEWLGEVPAHWEVGPLKRFADVLSGYAFPSTGFSSDPTHHRLLRGINIAVGEMRWDEVVRWPDDEGLEAFRVFAGDIVLGMDRPWIADGLRVARLTEQDAPSLLLQRVTCIRPSTELASQHLLRLFVNEAFYHHCAPEMTGVSVPHISPSQVLDYVVAVPPPAEQAEIDRRVSLETSAISDLVETAQQASALLHERRSALISAAVTGKIDVRGLSDHETEAA